MLFVGMIYLFIYLLFGVVCSRVVIVLMRVVDHKLGHVGPRMHRLIVCTARMLHQLFD